MSNHEKNPDSTHKVVDKRLFNADGTSRHDIPPAPEERTPSHPSFKEEPKKDASFQKQKAYSQETGINFPMFVISLASSVQMALGLIANPVTNTTSVNLASAKQTIDILGMLQEKTKGNLSKEEDHLLQQILFELRMQYVEIAQSKGKPNA